MRLVKMSFTMVIKLFLQSKKTAKKYHVYKILNYTSLECIPSSNNDAERRRSGNCVT